MEVDVFFFIAVLHWLLFAHITLAQYQTLEFEIELFVYYHKYDIWQYAQTTKSTIFVEFLKYFQNYCKSQLIFY